MKERNGQLRYLSIVIGAFLSVGVIVGLTNNLYSLYVIPITTGLGISRGLYSMGITVRYIASAFCNLFMGRSTSASATGGRRSCWSCSSPRPTWATARRAMPSRCFSAR